MNIPQKIENLVTQRKSSLPYVEQLQKRLELVNNTVLQLDTVCREAASGKSHVFSSILKQQPEIMEKLRTVNTKVFHECYSTTQETLKGLQTRFFRKHIHISFVGRAGQGKSLVMQNISGLSGNVIPSSDGSDCTGAKSIITNRQGDTVSAEITFYTQNEYLDVVNKYLYAIFDNNCYEVNSLAAISALKEKHLEQQIMPDAQKQAWYTQLEKYIEHSSEVFPLLGTVKTVPVEEIESYVAQYSSTDKEKKYYSYLGVKVANILCSFPCEQCGQIILVDTIGLGATAIDIREQMLETVGNDSDVILLMTRPDSQRPRVEQADIDIVTEIGRRVGVDYTRNMLFWIINRVSSGTGRNVDGIPDILKDLNRMPNLPVAGLLEVDCKDRDSVENNLLLPVLEQLSENLPEMDRILMEKAETQLYALYQEYHKIAEQAGLAIQASVDPHIHREFKDYIDKTYKKMTNTLRELYLNESYGKLRNETCASLKEGVEQKLKNILSCVPSKEQVMELLNEGDINQTNAYEISTDRLRLAIINDFLELNTVLHGLAVEMKRAVVHILASEDQGKLGALVAAPPEDADEWLAELSERISDYPKYGLISEALHKLMEFDLRMESFLIYPVRSSLDVIDISLVNSPALRGTLKDKESLADDLIFWLEHNIEIVHKNIRKELEPLYRYPNSAMWAVIKDFYDRIVYARDEEVNHIDVKRAWEYLYDDHIHLIWAKEYNSYNASKGVADEWGAMVKAIHQYDDKNVFCFRSGDV